jgi:hypothetical protein
MPSKVTHKNSRLADDIRESLREASNYFSGKATKAIVHRRRRPREDERGGVAVKPQYKKP